MYYKKNVYSGNNTTEIDKPKWYITCSECGVFCISVFRVKIPHKFVIRCVECDKKHTEELEKLRETVEDYTSTKITKVIDTKGKNIKDSID